MKKKLEFALTLLFILIFLPFLIWLKWWDEQ